MHPAQFGDIAPVIRKIRIKRLQIGHGPVDFAVVAAGFDPTHGPAFI